MTEPLSEQLLYDIAKRFEGSPRAICGYTCGQWAVISDLRTPGDMNNELYRGHAHDRDKYNAKLLAARMRYALELLDGNMP